MNINKFLRTYWFVGKTDTYFNCEIPISYILNQNRSTSDSRCTQVFFTWCQLMLISGC